MANSGSPNSLAGNEGSSGSASNKQEQVRIFIVKRRDNFGHVILNHCYPMVMVMILVGIAFMPFLFLNIAQNERQLDAVRMESLRKVNCSTV